MPVKKGFRHSEESKAKMSLTHRANGDRPSEECTLKARAVLTGRPLSEETKAKIAEKQTGKTYSVKTRRKMSEAHLGYNPTEETRQKLRENRSAYRKSNARIRQPGYSAWCSKRHVARLKGAEGTHTREEWENLKLLYGHICAGCLQVTDLTEDHIIPLVLGGSDYIDNIQPLCRSCNSKKHIKAYQFIPPWHQAFFREVSCIV